MIHLSERMQALAFYVDENAVLCDVGCDHGYLPIYLMQKGVIKKAIAMDIGKGPLSAAKEHIAACGLEKEIETRLSDGLDQLQEGEADTILIAGMGGGLVLHILEAHPEIAQSVASLILQPQSEIAEVRKYLQDKNYSILEENMVFEDGKYYPMMKVQYVGLDKASKTVLSEAQLLFGPKLLEAKHPVLQQYLQREIQITEEVLKKLRSQDETDAIADRIKEKEHYLFLCKEALA